MGGIIAGFMGGAAKGTAIAGQMLLADKLSRERDEASDLRRRELRTDLQDDRQEFLGADTDKRIASQEKISSERNASAERTATAKANTDNATTNMKDAASLRAVGYPDEVADAVAHGAMKQIKDEETGDMILINTLSNQPVGRLTSGGTDGNKEWIPAGGQTENAPISSQNRKAADKATSDKAGWLSSDETDFAETGGDRAAWRKKEAQRLANEERAGSKSGIVNSAVDIDRSTSTPAMPAPEKPAPSKISANKAPYPDGTELKGKDGKIYIVKNGKPVLKSPQ